MARYHYWQFLVNQEGQPINNAEIRVYLAGTNQPAYLYQSEFGSDGTIGLPQVRTNRNGYFEFWLGDDTEVDGYPIGQKFKLTWNKENISVGSIDWVDMFPGFAPVDETDETSMLKNKLVSNNLAYGWEQHIQHQDVTTTARPTFRQIRLTEDPYYTNDIVTKQYLDENLQGLNWQKSVISFYDPTGGLPVSPSFGDRHIASATANGWTENNIYEYNEFEGPPWIEIEPIKGYSLLVEDEVRHYYYSTANGGEWIKFWAGFYWYPVSTNSTLDNRSGYLVDCRVGPLELAFPPNPKVGSEVHILDYTGNSETNPITLDANGSLIEGELTFVVDIDSAGLQFVYTGAEFGWKMFNEVYSAESLTKIFEEYHEIWDTDAEWIEDTGAGNWYIEITHARGTAWPDVSVYDADTRIMTDPISIKSVDNQTVRIRFAAPVNIMVKIS